MSNLTANSVNSFSTVSKFDGTSALTAPPIRGTRFSRVFATVVVIFVLLELVTRTKIIPASKDFSRFASYSNMAEKLVEKPGPRIAFIGNSTTQRAIEATRMSTCLDQIGLGPNACEVFAADASRIHTWYYMLNHFFWQPERRPDLFVITFYGNSLSDANRVEIGRLAMYFTSVSDWPEILEKDLTSSSDRLEFISSSYWATLAARHRLKERSMKVVVPDYEEYTREINEANRERNIRHQTSNSLMYHTLARLLIRLKETGTPTVFVAFPTIECREGHPYPLSEEPVTMIRDGGVDFIDLRELPELTTDMYADELHLAPTGQEVYMRKMADLLKPLLEKHTPNRIATVGTK